MDWLKTALRCVLDYVTRDVILLRLYHSRFWWLSWSFGLLCIRLLVHRDFFSHGNSPCSLTLPSNFVHARFMTYIWANSNQIHCTCHAQHKQSIRYLLLSSKGNNKLVTMEDPGTISTSLKLPIPNTQTHNSPSPRNRRSDPVINPNTTFYSKRRHREILHFRCLLLASLLSNGIFSFFRNAQFSKFD